MYAFMCTLAFNVSTAQGCLADPDAVLKGALLNSQTVGTPKAKLPTPQL